MDDCQIGVGRVSLMQKKEAVLREGGKTANVPFRERGTKTAGDFLLQKSTTIIKLKMIDIDK
jgi:hypothetical protein